MIERQAIRVDCPAATPEEAIREAGNALCRAGACSPQYVQAMVDSYRELGPYFVIAPGLALPHARPEQGAMKAHRPFGFRVGYESGERRSPGDFRIHGYSRRREKGTGSFFPKGEGSYPGPLLQRSFINGK